MYKYENRLDVLKPFEENRDYMNMRVSTGIEKNRKGWGDIKVLDAEGNPVAGAHITLKQKSHDFFHGANIFMLDEMETEEKNQAYKEMFKECFNLATVPFYWNSLEPEQGKPRFAADSPKVYRRPAPGLCVKYCQENGITPKAHCLNYDQFTPDWVPKEVKEVKRLLNKRFGECAEAFADVIPGWEVTNETHCNSKGSPFFNADDMVSWSFDCAKRHFPMNELIINEATSHVWGDFKGNRNKYFEQCQIELEHGARIDAIGMQYHMFYRAEEELARTNEYYNPLRLYHVMDTFAKLGKPLQVTEVTIPAYSWEKEDEELKNLYSIWFSHEAMEAIIYWNLVDGYAWRAEPGDMTAGENYYYGGLTRFDMSQKPAYFVLRDLFKKTWHTETEATTGDYGTCQFKGFYGKYDMEVTVDGKTTTQEIRLSKDAFNKFTVRL